MFDSLTIRHFMNYDKPECPNSDAVNRTHSGCERKLIAGREAMVCPLCHKTVFLK